jgi:hypothetical protein
MAQWIKWTRCIAHSGSARAIATATLGALLPACVSLHPNAPPAVATQPPRITASQAYREGLEAEGAFEDALFEEAVAEALADVQSTDKNSLDPEATPSERSITDIREQHAAADPPMGFDEHLDHLHDKLYTWTQGVVEATDHRFAAKDRELKPVPAAPFRIGMELLSLNHSDGVKLALDANLQMALKLPNIEDRLRIFITSDGLDETPLDAQTDSGLRAGVSYQAFKALDFDVGVQLNVPPVAFASVRWTRQFDWGEHWDFYPLAKLFAETDDGVGYVAATTFDRWSQRNLFRWSQYAKWGSHRSRITWTQTLIYAHAKQLIVPDRYGSYLRANDIGSGWGVQLLAKGGEDINAVEYYEAGVFFRKPAANRWLYWYVEPLVRWDRKYSWDADVGIRMGITALFWDLVRPARR